MMKIKYLLLSVLAIVPTTYAIDFIPHFSDEDITIYIRGNGTLGYGQYHFMNNVGDVLYVAANHEVVGGYSHSNHVYYWDPLTNTTINLTPDKDDYWDYYAQALNDYGYYFYYGNKKNSPEIKGSPYVYGLNNNNDYLWLPQYSDSYFIGNEGRIRFNNGERALFLNDNRDIAGYIKTNNRYRAVRISDISINRDLEEATYFAETLNLVGNNNSSFPTGIDAQGNIVGWMYRDTSDGSERFTYATAKATLWTDSDIIDLGFPEVRVRSSVIYHSSDYGLFINDNGDVVQISGQGVFLNQNGIVTDLTPMITDCIEWNASWERWGQDMGILDVSNYGILMYHDYPYQQLIAFEFMPPVEVSLDIKPQSCPNPVNVKSKGVLPVAILGSDVLDVYDIDIDTVLLEGVSPITSRYKDETAFVADEQECGCHSKKKDAYVDLSLKFKTQEVIEALGEVVDGETWMLHLTGNLKDGTQIEGTDCIVIKKKGKK